MGTPQFGGDVVLLSRLSSLHFGNACCSSIDYIITEAPVKVGTTADLPLEQKETEMDRVERVARAMCEADGEDPDAQLPTGELEPVITGGPFVQHHTQQPIAQPAWKALYEQKARQFIAAFDACQSSDDYARR